jgi:peptidyl-Asp metalloendopeptidase
MVPPGPAADAGYLKCRIWLQQPFRFFCFLSARMSGEQKKRPSIGLRRLTAAASVIAILLTVLPGTSGTAVAAGLFDPATAIEMRAAARSSLPEGALRNRLVRLNSAELANIVPAGADNAADRLDRARALSGAVALDLFPGVSVTARRTDMQAPEEGGYVWVGRGGGAGLAWVTLVINDNEVLGHVQTGGRLYRIEPVSGSLHQIIEVNQDRIRDDLHLAPPDELQKQAEADAPAVLGTTTTTTISVMVAHTVTAREEIGTATKMQARINLAISLANQAFTNSGVKIRFKRVGGTNEINYNEANYYGGMSTSDNYVGTLCDLTGVGCSSLGVSNSRSNVFSALRNKRNAVDADLVILMRKRGSYCGVAWVLDPPKSSDANRGFSVVTSSSDYFCIEGNTLAHEAGHNMGLHHDRAQHKAETGNMPSSSKINFGHVDKTGKFFDIMAYRSSCGSGCTRAPYFSTPLKKYPDPNTGRRLGIPQNFSGAADATRTLNSTRTTVRGFR